MCMICDGNKVVVIDRKEKDGPGITFPGGHVELQSSDEGEVWWEEVDKLPNLNLLLDMNDMIRVFVEDELSEFFYYQSGDRWIYDLK